MFRRTLRSNVAPLFVVALVLLASWPAQARPLEDPGPLAGAMARFTAWVATLLGDYGCVVDPNGRCRDRNTAAQIDIGCSLDPSGRCRDLGTAADQIDIGCSADPNGGCRDRSTSAAQVDIGCSLDPDGRGCGAHE